MVTLAEAFMTLKLVLELLALLPAVKADADKLIAELKTEDDGETKLKACLDTAELLVQQLRAALN